VVGDSGSPGVNDGIRARALRGDSNPRYRLRGTTVFEVSLLGLCHPHILPTFQCPSQPGPYCGCLHPFDRHLHGLCALGDEVRDDVRIEAPGAAFKGEKIHSWLRRVTR
jgi:hypothetical protein